MKVQDKNRVKVVAISGSLREGSHTKTALQRALEGSEEHSNVSTEIIDPRDYDLSVFDPDKGDAGDAQEIREKIREADAVILGTPMYHGSYSSSLKTVIDYAGFDEFEGKTVGILVVAGGGYPTTAFDHLRSVMRTLKAWVIPHQVAIPDSHDNFEDGRIADDELGERVAELGRQVVRYADVEEYNVRDSVAEPDSRTSPQTS